MLRKLVLLLACALILAPLSSAFATDDSWNQVKAAGKLVVGLDDAFPPMGFRTEDGDLTGFDIDAAEEVGRRLGLEIVWQPTAWDGVIHSLNAKKFDCIWNGMTITAERAERVLFTKPYIMDGQIAIVRFKEKRFKSIKDLDGVKVGAQKGSSAISAVAKLPGTPADVREYADNPKALLDLESGRLDTVVIDAVGGGHYISKRPGKFRILPGFISKEPFGIAFRTDEGTLQAKVQQTIDAMVADGSMAKISRKWFGEDIANPKGW